MATTTTTATQAPSRAPALFVSHGSGPYALLNAPHQAGLISLCNSLRRGGGGQQNPEQGEQQQPSDNIFAHVKGILVLTAHWETPTPHISHAPDPGLWHDYADAPLARDLPPETWSLKYPARGDPGLAERARDALARAGLDPVLDEERGWDHGVWVPLGLLRPEADLPVVQVSIPLRGARAEDDDGTEAAFRWGQALGALRDEGYMVLGSGSSYHNFEAVIGAVLGKQEGVEVKISSNRGFEEAMAEAAKAADPDAKWARVKDWRREFPDSEAVHPLGKSEHFLPFVACLGAAGGDVGRLLGEWDLFSTINSFWIW